MDQEHTNQMCPVGRNVNVTRMERFLQEEAISNLAGRAFNFGGDMHYLIGKTMEIRHGVYGEEVLSGRVVGISEFLHHAIVETDSGYTTKVCLSDPDILNRDALGIDRHGLPTAGKAA